MDFTEVQNKIDEHFGTLKTEIETIQNDTNKTIAEVKNETTQALADFTTKYEEDKKKVFEIINSKKDNHDGLIRSEFLTAGQLHYASQSFKNDFKKAGEFDNMLTNMFKDVTKEDIENHFAALENADPTRTLPLTHPRRLHNEAYRSVLLDEALDKVDNALANDASPALASAEILPVMAAMGTIYPLIPVETMLRQSSKVTTLAPFSKTDSEIVPDGDVSDLDDTNIGGGNAVSLNAVPFVKSALLPYSFVTGYAFGNAVSDAMMGVARRIAKNLDEAIGFGDSADAGNINNLNGAGGAKRYQRAFDGFAKAGINGAAGLRVDAGNAAMTRAKVYEALGKLGEDYVSDGDVILAMPIKSIAELDIANVFPSSTITASGVEVGMITKLGPITLVMHDGVARANDGKVKGAANNFRAGVLFNRLIAKGGFYQDVAIQDVVAQKGIHTIAKVIASFGFGIGDTAGAVPIVNMAG